MPRFAPVRARLASSLSLSLALVTAMLVLGCGPESPQTPSFPLADGRLGQELKNNVSETGALTHLRALQKIADENGGNRASPGPGYDASVDYVAGVLRGAGYYVSTPTYEGSREDGGRERVTLRNVIAQTRTGDPGQVVTIGAHLDSVTKGPGIVDNGSGVATLLEIAGHLGASPTVRNAVRFAFFGSEETGAEGSTGYVKNLSAEDRGKIILYLNVDMVASPNGGYFAQGGKGHDKSASGPPGSATVAHVLADQLGKTGVTAEFIEFVGDDEAPFVDANIPSGGAENGDRQPKSPEQAAAWGGQAGEKFDPCYHKACDRLDNVNLVVLDHYLHALAGTVAYFAMSEQRPV
ncbi:MAG TPA: M28 family peptidase [Amycolatopsis sp.]|uniref:M28 family peptidase n=1 Tax=Amycolatopsis sp. TaxID=37632 RepID=UPI002B49296B|nr:M28 family peptidase [Amycolatopsis sp.]HKS49798.1 M28 family peptidase [Amycolatopsis sp.]